MPIPPVSASSLFSPLQPAGGGLQGLFQSPSTSAPSLSAGFAPADAATDADPLELFRSLSALGASVQSSLLGGGEGGNGGGLGSLFGAPPSGAGRGLAEGFGATGPVPGSSSAAADILGAFYQPQFDLLGDVLNSLG